MEKTSWILSLVIGLVVILLFLISKNRHVINKETFGTTTIDIQIVRKYCVAFIQDEYRRADEMKANTIDAIERLIKAKVLNPQKMIPGNEQSSITHNCKYFYSVIN